MNLLPDWTFLRFHQRNNFCCVLGTKLNQCAKVSKLCERIKLLTLIEEERKLVLCEKIWYHSLRHFIKHLLCIGGKKNGHTLLIFIQRKNREGAGWAASYIGQTYSPEPWLDPRLKVGLLSRAKPRPGTVSPAACPTPFCPGPWLDPGQKVPNGMVQRFNIILK